MSVSEEATTALVKLHSRLKLLEDTVQGSVESGTSGVFTTLAARQHKWNSERGTRDTTL